MRLIVTRLLAATAAFLAGVTLLTFVPAAPQAQAQSTQSAIRPAADLSQFRAGNIISDAVFTNAATMNASQVQSFLQSKVSACRSGYTCLKDFRQDTPNKSADRYCNGYAGAGGELASTIIAKVAQSCGINPQVLVVMLQKEQGLVTDSWPVGPQYAAAMGQACPDTAPCDPGFAGFFAQVYGGARQMKIYLEGVYFTWYAPGHTWNILYKPNTNCGSSPVYIENAATSALYYYTPYQPNAAALAAGYGTGDSCSAYGNRNFYNYFTDWFGSTQGNSMPSLGLARAQGDSAVYLINGGARFHVLTIDDLNAFQSVLGGIASVTSAQMTAVPLGMDVQRYVHDARTGTLYLLEPDGTKHRFTSAAQIASFGYAFNSYVNMAPALADLFATGADVGTFIRFSSSAPIYLLDAGKRRYVTTMAAWQQVSVGTPGYVASMSSASAFAAIPEGAPVFARNSLIRGASSPQVYLRLATGALLYVPNADLAADYGATVYAVVPDSVVAGMPKKSGQLTAVVQCGTTTFLGSQGSLIRLTAGSTTGVPSASLDPADCNDFSLDPTPVTTPLFVSIVGQGEVYLVQNGQLRHVREYSQLLTLNGGQAPQPITWNPGTAQDVGFGGPILPDGSLVQFAGSGEVYRYSVGDTIRWITDYSTLLALGNGRVPPIETLPASFKSTYTVGAPLLAAGDFVRFGTAPEVYLYNGAQLQHITTMEELVRRGGGKVPPILVLPAGYLAGYPVGAPLP
ncbi:hypothetical protein [Microbacterium sp. 22242]|uniref:hypothetical protein n=1 Tax=Microbacterium sp. 22242 TaxID=3453896 RepID=UPI003F86DD09